MKKLVLSVAIALFATGAFAQTTTTEKAVKQYGFWDNWFIQGQIGASENFSENFSHAGIFKLTSPTAAVSVGKYFSPEMGARIQVNGWQARNEGFYNNTRNYYNANFVGGNFDALFNLTNIFCPYKENRFFNLVGIMGIGAEYRFKLNSDVATEQAGVDLSSQKFVSPRLGLQANFRLSEAVDFNVEANANLDDDFFNGLRTGKKYEGRGNLLVGLTYKFPQRGFKLEDAVDPSTINALNDKINSQRQQISDLEEQLKAAQNKPAQTVAPASQVNPMNGIVRFRIGKSVVDEDQKASLYTLANYIKANNLKVSVVGYADKATGKAEVNQKVSEKRAASVAKVLENYGVDSSNITTDAKGDTVQPFDKNDWNRVVIVAQ